VPGLHAAHHRLHPQLALLRLRRAVPYSRWSSALLGFLRDVCEPYLSIFRRFIPSIGALDLSPIVAILVLNFVGQFIASLIRG
jgi:YggT family protein